MGTGILTRGTAGAGSALGVDAYVGGSSKPGGGTEVLTAACIGILAARIKLAREAQTDSRSR